jgi:hypothetical protein
MNYVSADFIPVQDTMNYPDVTEYVPSLDAPVPPAPFEPPQDLTIHGVKSILANRVTHHTQGEYHHCWRTIEIQHAGGVFRINLHPENWNSPDQLSITQV